MPQAVIGGPLQLTADRAGWAVKGRRGWTSRRLAAPETELKPYDQVTIFRQPGFELQRTKPLPSAYLDRG